LPCATCPSGAPEQVVEDTIKSDFPSARHIRIEGKIALVGPDVNSLEAVQATFWIQTNGDMQRKQGEFHVQDKSRVVYVHYDDLP
jgi:hypothetical protein